MANGDQGSQETGDRIDGGEALALAGGQAKPAAEVLRQAALEAAEMGAVTEQGRAEQVLRRLGVRTWRRPPASKGERPAERLSPRQGEIARLVANGATNRERSVPASSFHPRRLSGISPTFTRSLVSATTRSWQRCWGPSYKPRAEGQLPSRAETPQLPCRARPPM
jgi:hypothetical protein